MSAITLPSGVEVSEGKILILPGASTIMPTGDLTPAEVQALRDDVASVLGMTSDDLGDVDLTGVATGMILVRRSDVWKVEDPSTSIEIVRSESGAEVTNVKHIYFRYGLTTIAGADGVVTVEPIFAGSGTTKTFSRSDHSHPPTLVGRYVFNKAGAVLGGGTSSLVDETVTGLVPGVIYDVQVVGKIECVNTNLSGRVTTSVQIGSHTAQVSSNGFSGGVWSQVVAEGARMGITGVTSLRLQYFADYESGDPTALYSGRLTYSLSPRGGQS